MSRARASKGLSGNRVKLNAKRLRKEYLSGEGDYAYTRVIVDGVLAGNVFGCRYTAHDKNVCWVTQLVVHSEYRRRRLASSLLTELQKDTGHTYGVTSSHPAACIAASKAFGGKSTMALCLSCNPRAKQALQTA